MFQINEERQAQVDAAAKVQEEAHALVNEAHAKLRRVRAVASIEAAREALDDAILRHAGAVIAHTEARIALLVEFPVDVLAKRIASARNHLYECTMSDYSVDSIRHAERVLSDLRGALEVRELSEDDLVHHVSDGYKTGWFPRETATA